MKKAIIVFSSILVLAACNNDKEEKAAATNESSTTSSSNSDEEKTGEFSFDGKSVKGTVTTQYFGDKEKGNFSVLCQHNEGDVSNPNFELLQITFLNEKETTNPSLKIYTGGSVLPMTEPEPGIVSVALSGVGEGFSGEEFTGSGKSTGSISVSGKTITIKDLVLYTRSGDKRTVNATIPF